MCRQVEEQLSAESLQLMHGPQVQPATGSRLACSPESSKPVPATTYVPTPAPLHDAVSTYTSSPDPELVEPLHKNSTFPSNLMPSTLVKSNSLNSMSWSPCLESAKSLKIENATLLPIHLGNHVTAPGSSVQQSSSPLNRVQSFLPGNAAFGTSSSINNLHSHLAGATANESAARKMLMSEVAKLEPGFQPNHVQQLSRLSGHGIEHRVSCDSTLFKSVMGTGTGDSMQDILDSAIEWQLQGLHQQQQRRSQSNLMQQACLSRPYAHTLALSIPALDCSQQGMGLCGSGLQEMPMQHANEHMGGVCKFRHH